MQCQRCNAPIDDDTRWCASCERAYDTWSRRYASDVVWTILAGGTVTTLIGMGLPLLGLSMLYAATAIFAGFATFGATWSANRKRRRQQFLTTGLPRAYLPSKT